MTPPSPRPFVRRFRHRQARGEDGAPVHDETSLLNHESRPTTGKNGGPCPYTSHASPLMIRVLRETHETPESVRRRLRLAGGLNRYGWPDLRPGVGRVP